LKVEGCFLSEAVLLEALHSLDHDGLDAGFPFFVYVSLSGLER